MSTRRAQLAINALAAIGIATILAMSFHLDPPEDHHAEFAQADDIAGELRRIDLELQRNTAIQARCNEQRGPNALAIDLKDGSKGCVDPRGHKITILEARSL